MKFLRAISGTLLAWGPWGILLLAVLDSAGIPIVEGVDVLVVVVSSQHSRTGYFSAVLAIIGSVIGSLFLFYAGRKGGEVFLDRKTQTGSAKRFRRWFQHYGGLTVFIPALVPVPLPLKIFVISAGALGMKRRHFVAIMLAARVPRYLGLAYLGSQLGTQPLEYFRHHVWGLLAISVALFLALVAAVKVMDRIRMRARKS